jgi:dTMP kinase
MVGPSGHEGPAGRRRPTSSVDTRRGDTRMNASRTAGRVGYTPVVIEAGARVSGWFITIEGPEGAGKTTQASALASHLEGMGLDVHVTREPGGTWLGERLRAVLLARTDASAATDPLTDAFLFNAARRQLVTEVIRPALEGGRTVICARYADSTLAYQGYGAGVPLDRLRELEVTATDGLTPDLTILLDLPAEDGLARVAPGDVTRFEAEFDVAFHRRVRDGFLALAAAEPVRFAVIDARLSAADVAVAVAAAADRLAAASEPRPVGVRTTG